MHFRNANPYSFTMVDWGHHQVCLVTLSNPLLYVIEVCTLQMIIVEKERIHSTETRCQCILPTWRAISKYSQYQRWPNHPLYHPQRSYLILVDNRFRAKAMSRRHPKVEVHLLIPMLWNPANPHGCSYRAWCWIHLRRWLLLQTLLSSYLVPWVDSNLICWNSLLFVWLRYRVAVPK